MCFKGMAYREYCIDSKGSSERLHLHVYIMCWLKNRLNSS